MSSQLMDEIWSHAREAWEAYEGDTYAEFHHLSQETRDQWFKVGTYTYEKIMEAKGL